MCHAGQICNGGANGGVCGESPKYAVHLEEVVRCCRTSNLGPGNVGPSSPGLVLLAPEYVQEMTSARSHLDTDISAGCHFLIASAVGDWNRCTYFFLSNP